MGNLQKKIKELDNEISFDKAVLYDHYLIVKKTDHAEQLAYISAGGSIILGYLLLTKKTHIVSTLSFLAHKAYEMLEENNLL